MFEVDVKNVTEERRGGGTEGRRGGGGGDQLGFGVLIGTLQYRAMHCNTIQNNALQYNTEQYITIQYKKMHYNIVQNNALQYITEQCITLQYRTMHYNTVHNRNVCIRLNLHFSFTARQLEHGDNAWNGQMWNVKLWNPTSGVAKTEMHII